MGVGVRKSLETISLRDGAQHRANVREKWQGGIERECQMAGRPGRSGRKPKPTHLKVLEGNPGKRPLNRNEPKPRPAVPTCPRHLSAEAKREWRRVTPLLDTLGLLTEIDRAALAMYCEAWNRWVDAEEALKEYGVMVKSPNGFPMQSPYLAVANKAMEQMRALLAEFGMSPASRTRISVDNFFEDDSEMAALLD
jgi:P27 family predicted phage terminase small subunit